MKRTITFGSRPSKLAQWQTGYVLDQLRASHPTLSFNLTTLVTQGDKNLDQPLPEMGGKGVFTAELEQALYEGKIDLAVHSLKDLPIESSPGLCIGAISARANAQDVLISASGRTLEMLPFGARVGTSSLRREAQLRAGRPDLTITPLRGNVDTRLRKVQQGEYDAIILAAAGIERLALGQTITEYLSFDVMLPAPGQGALAIQCRSDDGELLTLLQSVHDDATCRAVTSERAFLAGLGGGCSAPVAAYASINGQEINLRGLVISVDGRQAIRLQATGSNPNRLGEQLARQALDMGAGDILQ